MLFAIKFLPVIISPLVIDNQSMSYELKYHLFHKMKCWFNEMTRHGIFLCTVYQSLTKWHSDNPGAQIQIEREFYEMFSWLVTYNSTHYLMRWSCRNSSGYKGSDNVIRIIDTEQPRSKWINSRVLNWLWLPTSVHLIRYQLYPITINQNKLSADWDEKKKIHIFLRNRFVMINQIFHNFW